MTQDELLDYITQSVRTNFEIIRKTLPFKTGNLSQNAYQLIKIDENKWDIKIDLNIAPYAEYINRPGYKTEGFWEKAINELSTLIAKDLGGTIEK